LDSKKNSLCDIYQNNLEDLNQEFSKNNQEIGLFDD
jgi:hypothetical protein